MNGNRIMFDSARSPVWSCEEVRQLDRSAVELLKVPPILLMENAGRSLVECLALYLTENASESTDRQCRFNGKRFLILCGKGNNGGDGFVMARRLVMEGAVVHVLAMNSPQDYKGEAAVNLRILQNMLHVDSFCFEPLAKTKRMTLEFLNATAPAALDFARYDWIVDSLLGTGAAGALRPPYDTLVRGVNLSGKPVFAVDIPSGLNADSGDTFDGTAICATLTCTLAVVKPGMLLPEAKRFVGELYCGDIGIPVRRK